MKYTAADAVIDAMDEAQRSSSTVQHVLAVEKAALRADLKAVAVALTICGDNHIKAYNLRKEALALPSVRAVLEGVKDG